MLYLLDFDRTLFDVGALYAALEELGKPELAGTLESLERLPIASFVYPDVAAFLATHGRETFILSSASGLTGEWETDYQQAKIDASGLTTQVAEVQVVTGGKGEAAAQIAARFAPPEPIIFVDDRLEYCLEVRAAVPRAICCLMVRDQAQIGETRSVQGMPVIHQLSEIDAIIEA